ncbi:MAG: DegT/DnrJ/EryC1/StrS family aminotransferase [Planctomycetota bacterium]
MIPFIDLQAQQKRIKPQIDRAIAGVMAHGQYIMGPEVAQLENNLAEYVGSRHCVVVSNGTDALSMALMAFEVGPGDAVITTPFTFFATVEAIMLRGATPIFADIDPDTCNIEPQEIQNAIHRSRQQGLVPRGVIAVDLFGLPADYDRINEIANRENLFVIQDGAQAFGAETFGPELEVRKCPNHATIGTTSFFPAKPLGCYGDGGAVFTNDDSLAKMVRSIRVHGKGADKYDNVRLGLNARLDTIQAAILIEKLKIYPEEFETRQQVATEYRERIQKVNETIESPDMKIRFQATPKNGRSAWAQFIIQSPQRDEIANHLKSRGIPSVVYYRTPANLLQACANLDGPPMPHSEKVSRRILALPFHPYLDVTTIDLVVQALEEVVSVSQVSKG